MKKVAKLTPQERDELANEYFMTKTSYMALAKKYGIAYSSARKICLRRKEMFDNEKQQIDERP